MCWVSGSDAVIYMKYLVIIKQWMDKLWFTRNFILFMFKAASILIAGLLVLPCGLQAQTVINGGFESGSTFSEVPSLFNAGSVGGTVTGWTVFASGANVGVGVWDSGSPPQTQAGNPGESFGIWDTPANGGQFLTLFPSSDFAGIGQQISGFQPNTDYSLTFEAANMYVQYEGSGGAAHAGGVTLEVQLFGIAGAFSSFNLASPYNNLDESFPSIMGEWNTYTMNFTTSSTVTSGQAFWLYLIAEDDLTGESGQLGGQIGVDGISIQPVPVPEPGSMMLVLGGLGLALMGRRRRV